MKNLADLSRPYEPGLVEGRTYAFWENLGYFTPKIDSHREPFTIVIPPPNVTGALHTGHALTFTIEDILSRWHRMMGQPTLWLPGTDHAAIATNFLLEQALAKEGLTRDALGRDKFLEKAWEWKEHYHARIVEQMKRLGVSVDWSRERFTMDEGLSRAVRTVFVRLHEEGLVYRGEYMGNWCPGCRTVISDLEVLHREELGELWYIRYPLENDPDLSIEVATTRPETMLGDTAVAVHPDDERYAGWVGKTVRLPIAGRVIPIIADAEVDPEFGTGAVKVTPAHDPNDFEIGRRHKLPTIEVMNADGTMNHEAGKFAGLSRFEARREIVEELASTGALAHSDPYTHSVGHCQRSDDVIEPRISMQWWVKIEPLAKPALQAVRDGRITIIPDRFTKVYYNWLENIHDWPISRQIWWGHRVPVWYCQTCNQTIVQVDTPAECPGCHGEDLLQDPDTLDTWFSSALWPFSTLGWPDDTEDLRYFYPTSVMETGYDILFFWVARMIMMSLHFMGEVPFRHVYLHGMVRDAFGQKMSKTKGNVVDPLDLMEQYGTDAVRLAMVTGNSPGNDLRLSEQRIESARNFANKIWNAARFVLSYEAQEQPPGASRFSTHRSALVTGAALPERWILSRASWAARETTRLLRQFQLGEAARVIQDFFWGEVCDWYMEMVKPRVLDMASDAAVTSERTVEIKAVLVEVLTQSLRLLHPFMPYVTEEIWQHLRTASLELSESIAIAPWPVAPSDADAAHSLIASHGSDPVAEEEMSHLINVITAIRNLRSEREIPPGRRIHATINAPGSQLGEAAYIVCGLANVELTTLIDPAPDESVRLLVDDTEIFLTGLFDVEAERSRIQEELRETRDEAARAEVPLQQPGFTERAPANVVDKAHERLQKARERITRLEQQLGALGAE